MRAWPAVMILAGTVAACSGTPRTPATNATPPAPAAPAAKPIDASAIPSTIRVLAARGGQPVTAEALQNWINERIAPKTVSVVVVETAEDALIGDLLAGKGDVAANVLLTFERDDQVAFAKPTQTGIRELVVTGPKEHPLVSLEDIGGRSIHVRKGSDHFSSLMRLNDQLKKINRPPARLVVAAPTQTDEDLVEQVRAGKIPATLVYDIDYFAFVRQPELHVNPDVSVSQGGSRSWVTRKDTPQLLSLLNDFIDYAHTFVS